MLSLIYAGLGNGTRDKKIHDVLYYKRVSEFAKEFHLAPNTVQAAAKRIEKPVVFDLSLLRGGQPMPIGKVAAYSFRKTALSAYCNYNGTFHNLELPCWVIPTGRTASRC
ncbi:hypothetical protein D3C84_912890 [compost metagenome]